MPAARQYAAMRPRSLRRLTAVIVASAPLAAAALFGETGSPAYAGPAAACGTAGVATVAAVDATAATDIYANELSGTEVSFDAAQVTGAADLLSAVAAGNRAAVLRAVTRIVYHPAWHIVRLRVIASSGQILADFGGPYVIAPVAGTLRLRGRGVGRFLMSVQDDTGYTKLETRFIGDPIGIYLAGKLVAERYAALPGAPPAAASLTLAHVAYRVLDETYNAFPSGTLSAVILVPPAGSSLERQPCTQVRSGEFGRIAERIARLAPTIAQHYTGFARTAHLYTGAEIFVRQGSRQIASSAGAGPPSLPTSGTVSYEGRPWLVFSFQPQPSTRVYVLAPPA